MTEGSEPINRLGVVDAEGNFTELAKIDYATDTDDLILAHTNSNGELRRVDADNSWKFNEPVEAPEASIDSDGSLFFGDDDQWSIKYNATAGSWVVRDETADGGVGEDVMTFNDAASAVELARSLGTETQPVPGTSHFEAVNTTDLTSGGYLYGEDPIDQTTGNPTATVTIPAIENYETVVLFAQFSCATDEDPELTVGSAGAGDYSFRDNTDVAFNNADFFRLFDSGGSSVHASAKLEFRRGHTTSTTAALIDAGIGDANDVDKAANRIVGGGVANAGFDTGSVDFSLTARSGSDVILEVYGQ